MREFSLLMVRLCAVFSVCLVIPILIGRANPPAESILKLHLTDCQLPCYLGITPMIDSLDDVRPRVTQAFPKTDYVVQFTTWDLEGTSNAIDVRITERSTSQLLQLSFMATANDTLIRSIGILLIEDAPYNYIDGPTLAELYPLIGSPSHFLKQPWTVGGIGLIYGGEKPWMTIHPTPIRPAVPFQIRWSNSAYLIRLHGPEGNEVSSGILAPGEREIAVWRGFTTY